MSPRFDTVPSQNSPGPGAYLKVSVATDPTRGNGTPRGSSTPRGKSGGAAYTVGFKVTLGDVSLRTFDQDMQDELKADIAQKLGVAVQKINTTANANSPTSTTVNIRIPALGMQTSNKLVFAITRSKVNLVNTRLFGACNVGNVKVMTSGSRTPRRDEGETGTDTDAHTLHIWMGI